MVDALASAIIAALLSGAANVAETAVKDAYAALKEELVGLVPRFRPDEVSVETAQAKRDELSQRLVGLLDEERRELAEASAHLAATTGDVALAAALRGYVSVRDNEAGQDIRVLLQKAAAEIVKVEGNRAGGSIHVESRTIT